MGDGNPAIINHAVAGPGESITEIEIIPIHEKILVKEADFFEDLPATHHESAVDRAHIISAFVVEIGQVVTGK